MKKQLNTLNERLSKTTYAAYRCKFCNALGSEVTFNIEGWLHHGNYICCLDTEDCKKRKKKTKQS
jgi:hypothetical protein